MKTRSRNPFRPAYRHSGTSIKSARQKKTSTRNSRKIVVSTVVVPRDTDVESSTSESGKPSVPIRSIAREDEKALAIYLREISETPLLKPYEEVTLAGRIKKGDEAARDQMIRANLRLVVKIARDYGNLGLPLLDLINEGNIGLMKAVDRFDPAKGAKLSTYAAWWIKQSIKRGLANQGKTIRLPVHLVDKVGRIRRISNMLYEQLGREPDEVEIGEVMGLKPERVSELITASFRPASLDAPLGEDGDTQLQDVVADENAKNAYIELRKKTQIELVHKFLGNLEFRDREILTKRFGLNGDKEKTLDEVGKEFGVTRERIRQLQKNALADLRKAIIIHEESGETRPPELIKAIKRHKNRPRAYQKSREKTLSQTLAPVS